MPRRTPVRKNRRSIDEEVRQSIPKKRSRTYVEPERIYIEDESHRQRIGKKRGGQQRKALVMIFPKSLDDLNIKSLLEGIDLVGLTKNAE